MITTLPAVQSNCSHVKRYTYISRGALRGAKRDANRRYRRYLNQVTHGFIKDPELFESEGFDAPSLSTWDLW